MELLGKAIEREIEELSTENLQVKELKDFKERFASCQP